MKKTVFYEFVYYLIYSVVIGLGVLFNINTQSGNETAKKEIIVLISIVVLIDLFAHINSTWRLILFGVIGAGISGFVLWASEETFTELMEQTWILLVVPVAVGSYILSLLIRRFEPMRIALGVICAGVLIFFGVANARTGQTEVGFMFFAVLLVVVDEVQLHWKKNGYNDSVQHFVLSVPFLAVILLVILMVPAPEKKYEWTWAKRLGQYVKETVSDITNKIRLSLSGNGEYFGRSVGFSESGELGGTLQDSQVEMMTMEIISGREHNIYLRGKTFSDFDGTKWTDEASYIVDNPMLDTLETMCAVSDGEGVRSDYIDHCELKITYMDLSSKYAFMPLKAVIKRENIEKYEIEYGDGGVQFDGKKGFKDDFPVDFYRVNRDSDVFRSILLGNHEITEDKWNSRQTIIDWKIFDKIDYSDYLKYHDAVYEDYGEKPELSAEMREFMDDLLEGADSRLEKLERIEELLGSFDYSTNPGDLPYWVDSEEKFLDYFVLESRKGYCIYYATAFVLMARAEGIPARYVQGYMVPECYDDVISVTKSMAHAWAEAYFDGIGWISFEPTPGYKDFYSWATVEERKAAGQNNIIPDFYNQVRKDNQEEEDVSFVHKEQKEPEKMEIRWDLVAMTAGIVLVIFLIIYIMNGFLVKRRFKRMPEKEKVLVLCKKNMFLLKYLGFETKQGETLEEFADRCREGVPDENLEFIPCYEKLSYAVNADLDGLYDIVSRCFTEQKKYLKKEKFFRYVLFCLRN